MGSTTKNHRAARELPRWVPRLRRILDIVATGGGVWVTEAPRVKR